MPLKKVTLACKSGNHARLVLKAEQYITQKSWIITMRKNLESNLLNNLENTCENCKWWTIFPESMELELVIGTIRKDIKSTIKMHNYIDLRYQLWKQNPQSSKTQEHRHRTVDSTCTFSSYGGLWRTLEWNQNKQEQDISSDTEQQPPFGDRK